jgi:hypothetical protein
MRRMLGRDRFRGSAEHYPGTDGALLCATYSATGGRIERPNRPAIAADSDVRLVRSFSRTAV